MTAIETIRELAAAGITGTEEIAAELTKRGVPPPTTDTVWMAEDVSRIWFADAWRRLEERGR
jgi:hypothetical protein